MNLRSETHKREKRRERGRGKSSRVTPALDGR